MPVLPLVAAFALVGCAPGGGESTAEDGFGDPTSVRITAPSEGATVRDPFRIRFEAGDEVAVVRLHVDGEPAGSFTQTDGLRWLDVSGTSGRHTFEVVGYDAKREELSRDEVVLRVLDETTDPDAQWVSFTTPIDGSHPVDPIQLAVTASPGVARVELYADDWLLGEVAPDQVLSYDFAATGFERSLEARAYDAEGNVVADDAITVTVETGDDPAPSDFNTLLLELLDTYPQDGTYTYYWPQTGSWSGSTRDVWYQGTLVADDGGFSSCFCSGITWELYLRAWQEWDRATGGDGEDLNGLLADEVLEMRVDWYVRELDGPGPSVALDTYGLGTEVRSLAAWQPGDLIQFWRTSGSGHTVVFLDWIEDEEGNRLGFDYASCQGSTDGLGVNDEYFGTFDGAVDPLKTYGARAFMPMDWVPWH